jgi:hypothetical protein
MTSLAACGGPTIEGGPCSRTDPCSDAEVCDYEAEGGPQCIPRSGDLDGDGLANDKDFCHHQPGGAFDEDIDGLGDDCDRCPIATPRDTPDSDSDMVDAPCDPNPGMDGDEILLFDSFQNGLLPRWEATTPSAWEVRGGEMIATLATVPDQEYMKTAVVGKNAITIEASFRVDKVEASASRHVVGVYANDPRPAGVANMGCYTTKADASTSELVVVETNLSAMNMPSTSLFSSANLYRAAARVSGTTAQCIVLTNGNPLGTLQTNITADQLTEIALTAHATSARFQYILVTGR